MEIRRPLRAVFFDADDTLFHVVPSVGHIYNDHFTRAGIESTPEAINTLLPELWAGFRREYENVDDEYRTTKTREREIWRKFSSMIHERFSEEKPALGLLDGIYDEFSRAHTRKIYEGASETIKHLKMSGFALGVLTNNDDRMVPLLSELGLSTYLDFLFPTSELGYKKPSRKCFEMVSERIKIPASHIVYVGDSLEHDYHGAVNAGWQAIWFNAKGRTAKESVLEAKSYADILRLLMPGTS